MKLGNPQDLYKLSSLTLFKELYKNIMKYPISRRFEMRLAIIEAFKNSKDLKDEREIEKARKRAVLGLANVLMYNEKRDELMTEYENTPTNYQCLNPKDEKFIYF